MQNCHFLTFLNKISKINKQIKPCLEHNMSKKAKRTRQQPIRTMSLIPVRIKITFDQTIPLYQKLASKIKELKALGMTYKDIAIALKISRKTIRKGLKFSDVFHNRKLCIFN